MKKQSKNKPVQCSFKKSKFNVFKSLDCKNVRNGKFWVCGKKKSTPLKTADLGWEKKSNFQGKEMHGMIMYSKLNI